MADEEPTRRGASPRGTDAVVVLVLMSVAAAIRIPPMGEMSLWWDELVHLQTASIGGFRDVLKAVKDGIPPGFGNAGAVPADYLLLNAWIRATPEPSPEWIEVYYRVPALVWSVLTVGLVYLYGRRFFDRGVALLAATIVTLSVSHSLYAAEVRNYSLFALMTVVSLYAFSALVLRRHSLAAWTAYTVVAVLYWGSGFLSLLVTLGQYSILAVLLAQDAWRRPGPRTWRQVARVGLPLASGLVVLAVVGAYLRGTYLGAQHGRPTDGLDVWERTYVAFDFFAAGNPFLLYAFAAGAVLFVLYESKRGRERLSIAVGMVLSFGAIPIIVEIERWKAYYFHPRHAFFLLPIFAIVAAAGLLAALRGLDPLRRTRLTDDQRRTAYATLGLLLVIATQAVPLSSHLENPKSWFQRSKTLRQYHLLTRHLKDRVATLGEDEVYLLIVERRLPGHIGNPVLAKYLEWHGLDDRVVLRGTDDPTKTRLTTARLCPDGCVGEPAARVQRKIGAIGPFNSRRQMLELVEVSATPQTGAPVGAVGLLQYWRLAGGPPRSAPSFDVSTHVGMSLFETPRRAQRGSEQ